MIIVSHKRQKTVSYKCNKMTDPTDNIRVQHISNNCYMRDNYLNPVKVVLLHDVPESV